MDDSVLEGPWRECFELAWEAFCAGTIPVGAVVADPAGEIVARGRNRIFEDSAPPGQLAGSYLAHAELNALAGLPRLHARDGRGPFDEHVLYTTLEPCALCMGAALMMMVGEVRFASLDHYGGGSALRLENPHTARLPLRLSGPLDGLLGDLGELLHLAHFVWRRPDGYVLTHYREQKRELVEVAEALDLMAAAQAGASLDDAIELVERARG
jgi:tRNA(Arg) A34 adenosine deaminase TadA